MLYQRILTLKQENSRLTTVNPIIDAFSLGGCQDIDSEISDDFIKEKRKNIIDRLKNYTVGYDIELKPALDEYNEAITYLAFRKQGIAIERFAERKNEKTPDFKVDLGEDSFYVEMKTLGFAERDANYLDTIDKGLEAQISIEQQIKAGRTLAIAETGFDPLYKQKTDYLQLRRSYFIETIAQKIRQNLKPKQFEFGKTVLFVDLSLIDIPFGHELNSIPFFQEPLLKSIVSGLLWNIAFGRLEERIFSPIEFEGASNVEGKLRIEGILNEFDCVKGLCFQTYNVSRERAIVGFYRSEEEELITPLLHSLCSFINDDLNTGGWQILQAVS